MFFTNREVAVENPINLVGARSFIKSVKIYSDEFASEARHKSDGTIAVFVSKTRRREEFVLLDSMHLKIALPIIGILLFNIFKGMVDLIVAQNSPEKTVFSNEWLWLIGIISALFIFLRILSKWHGAEHMVVNAYQETHQYDVETVKNSSFINKSCGGRFGAVVILLLVPCFLLPSNLYWLQSLILLVILLKPRWVDEWLCQNTIVDFLDEKIQQFVTVRKPDDKELLTAQCALLGLLRAHDRKVNLPPRMKLEISNK